MRAYLTFPIHHFRSMAVAGLIVGCGFCLPVLGGLAADPSLAAGDFFLLNLGLFDGPYFVQQVSERDERDSSVGGHLEELFE